MNRPAAAWFALGPTIAPTESPWPTGWEQCPRIDDGHVHEWESVLLEPDGRHRIRVEEVVRCSVCHAPCCGESRDVACGLLVVAATATAAWVRLADHPVSSAATRAQLTAIQACIRALEALPTRPGWDDDDGMPSGSHREGTQERRKTDTGSRGGSAPDRPAESRTVKKVTLVEAGPDDDDGFAW